MMTDQRITKLLARAFWAGLVMVAVFSAVPAFGATITVTSLADSGPGSLRAAIGSASPGDTINFSVTGTISLTSGELLISQNLTISGPGASSLSVSGSNSSRVFEISAGTTVTISGLTIASGNATGAANGGGGGGGLFNGGGTLFLSYSTISGNSATLGGGIFSTSGGTLSVSNSTLSGNTAVSASYGGGGIYAGGGTASVLNSVVTGNSASNYGGGVTNDTGTLQLSNSTLSGNSAARGGGIWNGDGGTLSVSNSTLSGNTASVIGGGIWNTNLKPGGSSGAASMLTLINSTLSGNSGGSGGGGIYNGASTLTATFSTISGNSAASGGGILNDTGTLVVQDTIVANSPTGGNCFGFNGTVITSQGYNLSDDTSCSGFFNQQGDFNNTPAGLDPAGLQNNGGPTKTIALLAGSSALNAIPGPCAVNTDQRGVVRLLACDIGAFEVIPDNDSGLAGLNGGNTFTGNQVVNGTVSATNFVGSISPTNISRGTAAIDISGTAANATNAVNATNAASAVNAANLGGIAAGNYARLDIGNNLNGNQNVTGNLTTTGSVGIGGGTPIIEHLSATFDPSFPPLKSLVCASLTFALAGTSPGDTVALGVSDSRMTGGGIIYSAWVSTPGNITLQGCSITGNQGKTAGSGAIRVDVWKH